MYNESIDIKWKGETHTCNINFELIKQMSREGFNVLRGALELGQDSIPDTVIVAEVISHLLRYAGVKVTEEEVYTEIMKAPTDAGELVLGARYALAMMFPKIDTPERSDTTKK